jgi:predicted dehydrogenase
MALITPARSHSDVIIQSVSARDRKKAEAFARKHNIPEVKGSYQEILDDPAIDCVYIPLPNGLHYEWTIRALQAGKHVLLEKPSVSNAEEAEALFHSPLLKESRAQGGEDANGPLVLLEAFHYRFQPSWRLFMSLVDSPNVDSLTCWMTAPSMAFGADDIRFNYELAGGCLIDMGAYLVNITRNVYAAEPAECMECKVETMPPPHDKCDYTFKLKWRMPNGGTADLYGNLRAPISQKPLPGIKVEHKPTVVTDTTLPDGQVKTVTRKLSFTNYAISAIYHRIDVEDTFTIHKGGPDGEVVKTWRVKESKKAYTYQDLGLDLPGETYWTSYRHQLEQFVNRVKGREVTTWIEPEESIKQMKFLDMAYTTSGLPIRPTCAFKSKQ